VIVDEAQDTNPVRRAIAHLALKDGGRLYAVGDDAQSIYGFTGASVDAMDLIRRGFNCRELPLTVSYRCARAVVERARTWVDHIEPSEFAPEGEVIDELPLAETLSRLEATDAILCRNTAPLVSVAYGLIARGRACRILGREIGEGLVNLIENQRAQGIKGLLTKLDVFKARECAKFIAKGEERRAEAVADRVDCIVTIIDALDEKSRTIPALIAKIRGMFVDEKKGEVQTVLTLCTAHKSKGKEWDRVAILCPDLMPSRAARQDWQYQQELNLCYVAATRAKHTLIYCADGDTKLGEIK
jgi:superfamily I DNA/RNA helicase